MCRRPLCHVSIQAILLGQEEALTIAGQARASVAPLPRRLHARVRTELLLRDACPDIRVRLNLEYRCQVSLPIP